ncbi:MAG: SEC59/DGK1/VTE5 family protein [Cyanobacteriota bacterium]|nr:SEC59/DGK1/VTE5 family protein [Cyanobacteriota bacterium]
MFYFTSESAPLWTSVGLTAVYLAVIVVFAEALNRLTEIGAERTRKIVHIGAGNVILLAWVLKIPAWVGMSAAAIASLIAIISYFLPILPSINSVGRKSLGTFFYAVSIGVLVGWFWSIDAPQYAAIGILVMAWGDGLAALIGQRFGKHQYQLGGIQKSWEGSLVMAVASFSVTFLILSRFQDGNGAVAGVAVAVALFATALEAFSQLGIDNLSVPVGSAALAYFLMSWLQ